MGVNIRLHAWVHRWVMVFLICCTTNLVLSACSQKQTKLPPFPSYTTGHVSVEKASLNILPSIPAEEILFTNLAVEDGLSQSTIGCIFQDSRGFMWFCTYEGVDRYDGYEFVNFNHDPQNSNSLRDNIVYAITEDRSGNLWFGTQSGLDVFNPGEGSFTHVSLDSTEKVSNSQILVTSLIVDQAGNLWVGSRQGVFRIIIEQDQTIETTYYSLLDIKGKIVDENPVGALYQDSGGVIWAGTRQGLVYRDTQTDEFILTQSEPLVTLPAVTQAIIEIKPGVLLLGGGYGLLSYDTDTRTVTIISDSKSSKNVEFGMVWSIVRGENGLVWIGADGGLFRMDPHSGKIEKFPQIQEDPDDLETVITVFRDREGNIWAGTLRQGLFIYQPWLKKFALPDQYILRAVQQRMVWALFKDRQGLVWVGTEHDLLKIDREQRDIERYPLITDEAKEQLDSRVTAIVKDALDNLWVGTLMGTVYVYNPAQDSFTRRFETEAPINGFFVDTDQDIWIGTDNGLFQYQTDQELFKSYLLDAQASAKLSSNTVNTIQEDGTGTLWIGTWDGLFAFDKSTNNFSRTIFSTPDHVSSIDETIFAILPDDAGGLWLGSQSGGLHHYHVSSGILTRYQDAEGITAGTILSILKDSQGHLWLSTQRGLSKFDPDLGIFTNYSHNDGLPSNEFNLGADDQAEDGEMFFGGIDGFLSFYPEEILRNTFQPAIVLSKITQNGEKIDADIPVDYLNELTLSWPNNYFEFEFTALSYAQPEDNQYAYYLEGVDPDWVFSGKSRSGRYVNLPGGTFTLHLIGSNNDGIWNTEGAKIRVTIIPPIWQRLWFQMTIFFGLAAITFAGFRYRVKSILSRSKELERLVDERTAALSKSNEQLIQEITEREKTERNLAQQMAAEAVLSERNRLARDLHDAVTQTIFSASILSETLPHSLDANPDKGRQQIDELQQLTRGALAELRSLLFELRPEGLVKTDLKDLLGQLCRGITGRSGIPVELACDTQMDVPSEIKITLYRIAQEALNNASRHADPSQIKVCCSSDQEVIRLCVQDDGKGFDYVEKLESQMGLGIMQERAADIGASLEVKSLPGIGTTITVEWLFPKNGDSDDR